MNHFKTAGRYLICVLPALLVFVIQYIFQFILLMALFTLYGEDFYQVYMDNYMAFMSVMQLISVFAVGLWYYTEFYKKSSHKSMKSIFTHKSAVIITLMALGSYFLITAYLTAAQYIAPGLAESYADLIESTGLGDLTLISTIATVILAPVYEEILFRGLTLKLAQRAGACFITANIFQAVLFGILHMDWIQGTYACILGLVLGFICNRYGSLLASMLMHAAFNLFGTYIAAILPENPVFIFTAVLGAGILLFLLSLKMLKKDMVVIETKNSGIMDEIDYNQTKS